MRTGIILFAFVALLISGCSTGKRYSLPAYSGAQGDYMGVADPQKKEASEISSDDPKEGKRMILYNADVTLKVKNTDTTLSRLKSIAQKYDGYAMSLGNTYATIRVKASMLNQAIADVALLGKIEHKNIYGEDVTEEFYDANIRLENANKARARYLELLAKAENVEAALKVEKELERLNGEIDLLEGKLNRLKHLEEYSTISVNIHQKKKLGILGYVSVGLYKGVKWLFVRG